MKRCFLAAYRILLVFVLLVAAAGFAFAGNDASPPRNRPPTPTLGKALATVFNAKREGKGALQRTLPADANLFDVISARKRDLQIAFVLDGTDSMGRDISSAKQTMRSIAAGLKSPDQPDAKLSFALIVYRDSHSPAGRVEIPLKHFTSDVGTLESALAKVKTQSGAPNFRELVDVGLYTALNDLDWAPVSENDVTRWILVCGDAPPYADGNSDANSLEAQTKWKSGRFHSDKKLLDLAARKGVQINAVICGSGFNNPAADNAAVVRSYESYLPFSREFFSKLAKGTGGGVLDLSQPNVSEQLVRQAQEQRITYQRLARITPAEIEQARLAISQPADAARPKGKTVRLAVLPHLPLSDLQGPAAWKADPNQHDKAAQVGLLVATEMVQKLRLIPGVFVRNATEVQAAYRTAQRNTPTESNWEQQLRGKLAAVLNVDYLIAGTYRSEGKLVVLQSGLYKRVDGSLVASTEEQIDVSAADGNQLGRLNLPSAVFGKLLASVSEVLPDPAEQMVFTRADEDPELRAQLSQPLSRNLTAQRYLLYGLGSLERSLAHFRGDSNFKSQEVRLLLETAVKDLKAAADHDPENPCPHLFLASCYYNLAGTGDPYKAVDDYLAAIRRAYELRTRTDQTSLQIEIKADHALLIEKNVGAAIVQYEKLTTSHGSDKPNFALRAHWMLAGIYSGDWGVPTSQVGPEKAREHIVQILARWPESPEARFYQEHLVNKADAGVPLMANSLLTMGR